MTRIALSDKEDLPPEEQDLIATMSAKEGLPEEYYHLIEAPERNVYRMFGNNPPILRAFRTFIGTVWDEAGLSARERELVILAVSVNLQNDYVWHQHVRVALKEGLKPEEINAVRAGTRDEFSASEQALLEYVPMFLEAGVADAAHEALSEFYEDETVVGIGALIGVYVTIVKMVEAYNVPTEEEFVGWDLERL